MTRPFHEIADIIWDGETTRGLNLYALTTREQANLLAFDLSNWPKESLIHSGSLSDWDNAEVPWMVLYWILKLPTWPSEIIRCHQASLASLTSQGAVISWGALEGSFSDPPTLFDIASMGDGVYAAHSKQTGFMCNMPQDANYPVYQGLELEDYVTLRKVFLAEFEGKNGFFTSFVECWPAT